MEQYTLEYLEKKFTEDILKAEKERRRTIDNFKECNPEEPLPDWMVDAFNLPAAIVCIIRAIRDLQASSQEPL